MKFSEKELAFLRVVCCSDHKHISQDVLLNQLLDAKLTTLDEFKAIKKKLLYAGIIGIVYGNITIENNEVFDLFNEDGG